MVSVMMILVTLHEDSCLDSPLLIDSVTGDVVQEEVELLEQEH